MAISSTHEIIAAFKAELKEIREECCMGKNLNYLYAQIVVLLNKYALATESLSQKDQQVVWKKLRRQLSPGVFIFNSAWRELLKNGRRYLQKMQQ